MVFGLRLEFRRQCGSTPIQRRPTATHEPGIGVGTEKTLGIRRIISVRTRQTRGLERPTLQAAEIQQARAGEAFRVNYPVERLTWIGGEVLLEFNLSLGDLNLALRVEHAACE